MENSEFNLKNIAFCIATSIFAAFGLRFFFEKQWPYTSAQSVENYVMLLILGGAVLFYRKKIRFVDGMPGIHAEAVVNIAAVCIGALFFLKFSQRQSTVFYIDNGTNSEMLVQVSSAGKFKVASKNFQKIDVQLGKHLIQYGQKTDTINFTEEGNWIFNIDTQSTYLQANRYYQDLKSKTKALNDSTFAKPREKALELVKEAFFKSEANFIFHVPKNLEGDMRGTFSRKILLRLGVDKIPLD
jgi:hypothetical protein